MYNYTMLCTKPNTQLHYIMLSVRYNYLLHSIRSVGFFPASISSHAGLTHNDDPNTNTKSLCLACFSAVLKTGCSKPSPKFIMVFNNSPSQP